MVRKISRQLPSDLTANREQGIRQARSADSSAPVPRRAPSEERRARAITNGSPRLEHIGERARTRIGAAAAGACAAGPVAAAGVLGRTALFVRITMSSSREKIGAADAPAYVVADAARYLRLPAATLRSWVVGRQYPTAEGGGQFHPLIRPASKHPTLLSFSNLIEAHVLRSLREQHAVSVKALRERARLRGEAARHRQAPFTRRIAHRRR